MRIILLQNIKGVGQIGDIKDVRDGFGRNFLLPKEMAILATPENLKRVDELKKKRELIEKEDLGLAQEMLEKLKNFTLSIPAWAGETGTLYAGVDAKKISQELKKSGINIDSDFIKLAEPIKEVGEYTIAFEFNLELKTEFKVKVEATKE